MAAKVCILDTETGESRFHFAVDAKEILAIDKGHRFKVMSASEAIKLGRATDTEARGRRDSMQRRMDAEAAASIPMVESDPDAAPEPTPEPEPTDAGE